MRLTHPNYDNEIGLSTGPKMIIKHLQHHALSVSLYWALCDYHTKKHIAHTDKNNDYSLEELLKSSKNEYYNQSPQIRLLSKILHITISKDFAAYPQTKQDFLNSFDSYTKSEQIHLVGFLIQICYENFKQGATQALQEHFLLYKFAVEQELVIEDGFIPTHTFQNIVNIACAAKQLEWAENFINEFSRYLNSNELNDCVELCKAIVFFDKENYNAVLEALMKLDKLHNVIYTLQAKSIKLKVYYKLNNYEEAFFSLVQSFQRYINRNKSLAEVQKKNFSNFIIFTNKLQKAKYNKSVDLQELYEMIVKCNLLVHKSWLLNETKTLRSKSHQIINNSSKSS